MNKLLKGFKILSFHGLYNSIWVDNPDSDLVDILTNTLDLNMGYEDVNDIIEKNNITIDWLDFDNSSYIKELNNSYHRIWVNNINNFLDVEFNIKDMLVFKGENKIISPKEYNFNSDIAFCDVEVDLNSLKLLLNLLGDRFKNDVKDEFSRSEGFIPLIDNDYNNWLKTLFNDEFNSEYYKAYIEWILNFISIDNELEYSIYETLRCHNGISLDSFYKIDESYRERFEKIFNKKLV